MATAKEDLERQLGTDNANAIEALVDEKLQQRSEDLEALRQEIVTLRNDVGDVPELKRQLNAAAGLLRDAIDDHNELAERRNAGEPVGEREVVAGEERVKRVSTDVESVRETLEGRVNVIEERLDNGDTGLEALHRRDEDLQAQINELREASPADVRTSKSGLKAALITFVVVFLFSWVIIMVTSDNESWLWAIAWAGIFAGLVGLFVGLVSKEGTVLNDFRNYRREQRAVGVEEDAEERPVGATRVEQRERVPA